MSDQTTSERVIQAVTRGYELVAAWHTAEDDLKKAKITEDEARLDPTVDQAKEAALAAKDEAIAKAESKFQTVSDKANVPYQEARSIYETLVNKANGVQGREVEVALKKHEATVTQAEQEHAMRNTVAQTDIHRAKAEIAATKETIDQNRQVVLDSLGIDLSTLVV